MRPSGRRTHTRIGRTIGEPRVCLRRCVFGHELLDGIVAGWRRIFRLRRHLIAIAGRFSAAALHDFIESLEFRPGLAV